MAATSLIGISSCSSNGKKEVATKAIEQRAPAATDTPNYTEIFKASRAILIRDIMTGKRNIQQKYKDLPETELIERLQSEGDELKQTVAQATPEHRRLLTDLADEAKKPVDTSKHTRLIPPKGTYGYEDLKFFSTHPYRYTPVGKKTDIDVTADNLVEVWNQFLSSAKKQIVLNVFDFDLTSIAETLIAQGKKGLQVRVGIDANVIKQRAEVQRIYDLLKNSGVVQVTAVKSIGLNHQKMAAIDWESVESARALFSSGNLTQSCLDPQGDLKGVSPLPPDSVPNANHVITMKSWLLANLINHELSKTLDPELQLRGAQYPLSGVYQITGPGIADPANLFSEARPVHSVVVAFTPGGGYKDVNTNLIARLINETDGPIRMIQFAFSADEVGEALLTKAQKAYASQKNFDYLSVGDTPFAMQYWSEFLKLSGWKLLREKGTRKKYYIEDSQAPWFRAFSPEQWQDLRSKIYIGPREYRTHKIKLADGSQRDVSAKIHHKILSIGDFAIVGTSFNFSKNAQKNNEQILIFHEPELARRVDGMTRWLAQRSGRTVNQEVQRRNQYNEPIVEETEAETP